MKISEFLLSPSQGIAFDERPTFFILLDQSIEFVLLDDKGHFILWKDKAGETSAFGIKNIVPPRPVLVRLVGPDIKTVFIVG